MNKNKKWFLAVSVATMLTANGIVMAATTNQAQPDNKSSKQTTAAAHKDFAKKGGMKAFQGEHKALLDFLKIDAKTFEAEVKDGKSLASIAQGQGISEQALKDFMVDRVSKGVDLAVKEGRIPANEADQTKAKIEQRVADMISGKVPMRGHHPGGPAHFNNAKLLEVLKMNNESLKTEMKAGKSLVTIGKEHGVSEQTIKDLMIQQMNQRIAEGVQSGRITAEKAEQMKSGMDKHVSAMINGKGPMRGHHSAGHARFNNAKLLEALKMDNESLKTEMKAGKSLVTIGKEHGVTEQTIKDIMVQQMTQRIDAGVQSGRITADKAEQMKSNMDQRISDMINGTGAMHKHERSSEK